MPIPRWLPTAGAILERGDFVFNNLKELWWIDSSMEGHKMDTLVSVLKLCPSLEKLFITVSSSFFYWFFFPRFSTVSLAIQKYFSNFSKPSHFFFVICFKN